MEYSSSAIILAVILSQGWSEATLTLRGPPGQVDSLSEVTVVCVSTEPLERDNTTLTLNGQGLGGFEKGFIQGNTSLEFIDFAILPSRNLQVAQCHFRDASSNPYVIRINGESMEFSINLTVPISVTVMEQLNITCSTSIPGTPVLRINGRIVEVPMSDAETFSFENVSTKLDSAVAQCTIGEVGSNASTIDVINQVMMNQTSYTVEEGEMAIVTVALRDATKRELSVDLTTTNINATAGSDYTGIDNMQITFNSGQSRSQEIRINTTENEVGELTKLFEVALSNPSVGLTIFWPNASTVYIVDDDVGDDDDDGLPLEVKIGIGVGVGVGSPLVTGVLIAIVVYCCCKKKCKVKQCKQTEQPFSPAEDEKARDSNM